MTNLEYHLHDEADALRIEIVGDLSGADVGNIEHAWRTASSTLGGRRLVIGLPDNRFLWSRLSMLL